MTVSYWLLLGTVFAFAAIILAGDLWWANRLRVAREQRDEWRRIAVKAATSDAESAAKYATAALRDADRQRGTR